MGYSYGGRFAGSQGDSARNGNDRSASHESDGRTEVELAGPDSREGQEVLAADVRLVVDGEGVCRGAKDGQAGEQSQDHQRKPDGLDGASYPCVLVECRLSSVELVDLRLELGRLGSHGGEGMKIC